MTNAQKKEITKIAKEFSVGFKDTIGSINGSGWLIVDLLSAYLNSVGFENKLHELKENDRHPQVLIMTFKDGSQLIPAGGDLKNLFKEAENWMWL